MLTKIAGAVALLVGILCAVIAMRPADFRLLRSTTVNAPPEKVFALINDFKQWESWSPWAKLDPKMKTTYSPVTAGTGATYAWVGNSDVGEGKMTITGSEPPQRVAIRLEFLAPFAATNQTEFVLTPVDAGTKVDWTMNGTNNFMAKAFDFVMNMDKTVGADFEKGLAQMRAAAESQK